MLASVESLKSLLVTKVRSTFNWAASTWERRVGLGAETFEVGSQNKTWGGAEGEDAVEDG